jgi:hypothetical protein
MAGSTAAERAFPWKRGMAEYRTSSELKPTREAARAARPCVIRTALGPPVEPDVKMRR